MRSGWASSVPDLALEYDPWMEPPSNYPHREGWKNIYRNFWEAVELFGDEQALRRTEHDKDWGAPTVEVFYFVWDSDISNSDFKGLYVGALGEETIELCFQWVKSVDNLWKATPECFQPWNIPDVDDFHRVSAAARDLLRVLPVPPPLLTDFQVACEKRISGEVAVPLTGRTLHPDGEGGHMVEADLGPATIWIYPDKDGAQWHLGSDVGYFEWWDYRDDELLIQAFVADLQEIVLTGSAPPPRRGKK